LATGLSWICYFKALSMGDVNKVVPIDKSSVILTIVLAIIIFGETQNLALKLVSTVVLAVGTLLMIEKKKSKNTKSSRAWMIYAVLSAVFASAQAILAKLGFEDGIDSNLGTAIRTGVVLVLAWGIVFARGKHKGLKSINGRELIFICLSGLATGVTWLCKYYAIQNGEVSVVTPIEKMSILVTIAFSYIVFKEKLSKKATVGLCLLVVGTLIMAIFT
jgi:transporter family protein